MKLSKLVQCTLFSAFFSLILVHKAFADLSTEELAGKPIWDCYADSVDYSYLPPNSPYFDSFSNGVRIRQLVTLQNCWDIVVGIVAQIPTYTSHGYVVTPVVSSDQQFLRCGLDGPNLYICEAAYNIYKEHIFGPQYKNQRYRGGALAVYFDQPSQQCPIAPLQPLPDDPCTQSLEAGRGEDKNGACTTGLTPEMQQEAQCLANKITSLGISYPGPTATVRTPAYQAHLREIWEKLIELDKLEDPTVKQACASRKAEIEDHKKSHGLKSEPAASSRHELGKAVDVGDDIIRELINRVTTDTSGVQDYINTPFASPPACNLQWGGRFQKYDPFHFQLP